MKVPKYISPTSLSKWESDREGFYLRYLADDRPPQEPQTQAMAIGSAFDAYVKSHLHSALFGYSVEYSLDTLIETQVDEHVRDWAIKSGQHVFEAYQYTGACAELLMELEEAEDVEFEFTATGYSGEVPIRGKPDCRYIHKSGAHVILDWKVNGYCSKRAVSPKKLYSRVRDGQDGKPSRNSGNPHKGYKPQMFKGVEIGKHFLEDANPAWADQLAIYGWMTGEEVGAENMVVRIDQIVAKPQTPERPLLRIANHNARISAGWQNDLVVRLQGCWRGIMSGHIFSDMTKKDSQARCEVLDMVAEDAHEFNDNTYNEMKAGYRG